jgi:hypothetical protein
VSAFIDSITTPATDQVTLHIFHSDLWSFNYHAIATILIGSSLGPTRFHEVSPRFLMLGFAQVAIDLTI